MKSFWLKKDECTGCGACANICPKQAIHMEIDKCGFQYPKIGENCIDCNLCEHVCYDRIESITHNWNEPQTYAAWSKNDEVRFRSTSGGAFTELSQNILNQNGFVVGAKYREDNLVEHCMIYDEEGLAQIQQSKYIQSDMHEIYKDVKRKLEKGELVAFCGAPCQVAALYAFLGNREYEKLITFDFICRGMNSPKAYRSWLDEIEKQNNSKVTKVWFKYKDGGWKTSPRRTRIDFEDGHYLVKENEDNLFMQGYLTGNLYIRPSCGNCNFKGVPRKSDITLADFWGIEQRLDNDKGTSMVLINSEKGKVLFEKAKDNMHYFERNFSEIFAGNTCFDSSVKIPKNSKQFLRDLDKGAFSKVLGKYTSPPLWRKVVGKIKMLLKIFSKNDEKL